MNSKKEIIAIILLFCAIILNNSQGFAQKDHINLSDVFRIKGDSITDDTQAIQNAINSGIKQIFFDPGTYRITSTIEIDLEKVGPVSICGNGSGVNIIMDGPGPAFRFVGTHKGIAAPSTVKQNVWRNQRMPVIDGLEITGQHKNAVGIEATGTMQLTITRVLVREALHGIHLTNRNRNVIISECHFYHNSGIGIYLDDVDLHQINISNSHISYNGGGGIVVRNGSVRNLQIGSCDIEANMNENGPPTANVFIDQKEGTMLEGAIVGCTVQHDHNAPGSANIWFIGHNTEERGKTGNFTIADNVLSDTQYNIHIQYARGIIITGNTFWKGYTHNILIKDSEHLLLSNNLLDRNPDYRSLDSNNGIIIQNSSDMTINGLHLFNIIGGKAGIVLERCWNYNLMNSTILNCEGGGIELRDTKDGKVSGNFIKNDLPGGVNKPAIKIDGGKNNLIINNYTNNIIDIKKEAGNKINNYSF